jgi:hypothetical protein
LAVTSETDARAKIARACRELLDVYEREPALFRRTLALLTPENIETLRELATWDVEDD